MKINQLTSSNEKAMQQFKPYKPRHIHFADIWEYNGWRIKIYYLFESEDLWDAGFIDIAKSLALHTMRARAETDEHHHAGFLAIHVARMFNQVIFDWWARENELRHIVFKANADAPTSFVDITATGEAFCVWELQVISHEREAWIRHVLENAAQPDIDAYFEDRLDGVY